MTTLFALENSIDFGANLLAKVSPARDPTAKNAKEGLSRPLVSSSRCFRTTRWLPSRSKTTFQLIINPKDKPLNLRFVDEKNFFHRFVLYYS